MCNASFSRCSRCTDIGLKAEFGATRQGSTALTYQTTNPATGTVTQIFPGASDMELEAALATAHACYQTDWRHRSIEDRARIMRAAATGMRTDKEHLAQLVTLEMGKLIAEARAEVTLAADILDYYAKLRCG